jgi:hypothetical protein
MDPASIALTAAVAACAGGLGAAAALRIRARRGPRLVVTVRRRDAAARPCSGAGCGKSLPLDIERSHG